MDFFNHIVNDKEYQLLPGNAVTTWEAIYTKASHEFKEYYLQGGRATVWMVFVSEAAHRIANQWTNCPKDILEKFHIAVERLQSDDPYKIINLLYSTAKEIAERGIQPW